MKQKKSDDLLNLLSTPQGFGLPFDAALYETIRITWMSQGRGKFTDRKFSEAIGYSRTIINKTIKGLYNCNVRENIAKFLGFDPWAK